MLKPLIKYTGGKYKEYEDFKKYIPENINNYFEPFFGGGGVFFRLYNDGKINGTRYINDYSKTLMEFYESVASGTFVDELNKISDAWDDIRDFGESLFEKYGTRFWDLMLVNKNEKFINDELKSFIEENTRNCKINLHGFSLPDKITHSLEDKLNRFRNKDIKNNETDLPYKCITTSVCQAFYFVIRDMYNDWNNRGHQDNYTQDERSAQWFFIKEYCFGSMSRFGSDGDYNIPYGGFAYNDKCFSCKIENIISEEAKTLFQNTNMSCGDFKKIIESWKYKDNDFMFLDPPYDSTFTDYDGIGFNRKDHIRLANTLKNCKCKWLMAIGKTDFITNLYKDYYMDEYDKTYMYQARGSYDNKHTTHLIITNYKI